MTHTESFKRFTAQPIGRAKLYLIDYATTVETKRAVQRLFNTATDMQLRTVAAMTESVQPNESDFVTFLNAATK